MAICETEAIETVIDLLELDITEPESPEDFAVPAHEHDFRVWPGVCATCGVLGRVPVTETGNFQDPFPRFGADEYLTW